jgi:hypothetical protein
MLHTLPITSTPVAAGHPGDVPPHPVPEGVQPRDRRPRDEREGDIARVEVREVRELVDEHRAPAAALVVAGAHRA